MKKTKKDDFMWITYKEPIVLHIRNDDGSVGKVKMDPLIIQWAFSEFMSNVIKRALAKEKPKKKVMSKSKKKKP